jgi:hypothetical protein
MDDLFAKEYSTRLYMLAQQSGNVLRPHITVEPFSGAAEMYFDTLSPQIPSAVQPSTQLHGDTPISENNFGVRKVTPAKWELGHQLDSDRLARMKLNPTGGIMANDIEDFGRFVDQQIITAALGVAITGKDGLGPQLSLYQESVGINGDGTVANIGTLPAVATVTGLTIDKIRLMKYIMDKANAPKQGRKWAVDPADIAYLLTTVQVTNSDYNTVKALSQGEINTFCGFEFINMNGLPLDAATSTATRTFAFVDKGIILSELSPLTTKMAPDPGKKFETIIYSKIDLGCVRMEGVMDHECLTKAAFSSAGTIVSQ